MDIYNQSGQTNTGMEFMKSDLFYLEQGTIKVGFFETRSVGQDRINKNEPKGKRKQRE
jgi:hypothetical protein